MAVPNQVSYLTLIVKSNPYKCDAKQVLFSWNSKEMVVLQQFEKGKRQRKWLLIYGDFKKVPLFLNVSRWVVYAVCIMSSHLKDIILLIMHLNDLSDDYCQTGVQ